MRPVIRLVFCFCLACTLGKIGPTFQQEQYARKHITALKWVHITTLMWYCKSISLQGTEDHIGFYYWQNKIQGIRANGCMWRLK